MSPALVDCFGNSGPHWKVAGGLMEAADKLCGFCDRIGPTEALVTDMWSTIDFSNPQSKHGENANKIFHNYVNSTAKGSPAEGGLAYERILANLELDKGNKMRAFGHYVKAGAYGSLETAEVFLFGIPAIGAAYVIGMAGELPLACYRKLAGKLPEHSL